MNDVQQVAILGTGLLGGSIGLALRDAGWTGRIVGVGRREATLERARSRGCIDRGTTDVGAAVAGSDLVVLATPLSGFEALLKQVAQSDHEGLVVTDVGSAKVRVCNDAKRLLPDPSRFVGAHPMAGSEQQGPEHARADLFRNRLCILTPSEPDGVGTDASAVQRVADFWTTLGMRLAHKSPVEHDRLMAVISHLPHAVASLLVHLADEHKAISVAAAGFRDTTRIASGDPRVWVDIFQTNRSAVIEALDAFAGELGEFRRLLVDGQDDRLVQWLEDAKAARDQWLQTDQGKA